MPINVDALNSLSRDIIEATEYCEYRRDRLPKHNSDIWAHLKRANKNLLTLVEQIKEEYLESNEE